MFGWLGAAAGVGWLRCPHCGKVQARNRRLELVVCKDCRKSFSHAAGRESMRSAQARAKRK